MTLDAIVIGGGPSGSAAAIALAQQGRRVAVVERSEYPRRKVCGEFVSAASLELLDRLGVGGDFREAAGPEIKHVALFAAGAAVTADMPRARSSPFGRAIGRDLLDRLLLERARTAGATVLQPWRATGIVRAGDRSAVQIESGGECCLIAAPVVIAAHGAWEAGKLPSQLRKTRSPGDFLAFKAHFRNASLPPDLMPLLAFPGGYGGMVWSDSGRLSLSCCIRRDLLPRIRARNAEPGAGEAVLRHILANCPEAAAVLRPADRDGEWLAAGPIRPGERTCFADGLFRVGNIAGESHPIIAEGISMAMQSAWLLAIELGRELRWDEPARQRAALRYAAAWRRQFELRILVAAAVARLATGPATAELMRQFVRLFPTTLLLGARLSGKVATVPYPG